MGSEQRRTAQARAGAPQLDITDTTNQPKGEAGLLFHWFYLLLEPKKNQRIAIL